MWQMHIALGVASEIAQRGFAMVRPDTVVSNDEQMRYPRQNGIMELGLDNFADGSRAIS